MRFSVVIPVYNGEKSILKALDSVFSQTLSFDEHTLEVVVVNDGSTDNTLTLINEYKSLNYLDNLHIYTIANGGVSKARNFGIKNAQYEWIAFLDADDVWSDNKLSLQASYINTIKPEPNFIGSARNNETLSILGRKITSVHQASPKELLIKVFPQTSTAVVKKGVLQQCGLYDETMTHSEDADLWVRICSKSGRFYYHPESTVSTGNGKHNFGDEGLSANLPEMQRGSCLMLWKAYKRRDINYLSYLSLLAFYKLKFIRRLLIVSSRRNNAL
ncbi:glycosyltransferase family A protein [Erwinia sp. Eh17-17]|uniref:glycosyltransferase family 2 protein n=1 Tax=Erwinia sp. Eh17-17 TaxID=3080330 RepID=UPI003208470B